MQLPNVKELEKILKLCRKQGIIELSMGDMSFKFGDLPRGEQAEGDEAIPQTPNDEDMLFWSAQPDPLAQRTE